MTIHEDLKDTVKFKKMYKTLCIICQQHMYKLGWRKYVYMYVSFYVELFENIISGEGNRMTGERCEIDSHLFYHSSFICSFWILWPQHNAYINYFDKINKITLKQ